ncbi:MAG: hypothetical protein ISS25_01970 [Nanoarchaeota archaeon]|nr:hypothetical protein [DPANN group archaeon]MBL7116573.1 hypothetical protein [Nanoarchaeota archaeon]
MKEDISKNTILVLVVLTVVISLLGTWTVINEVNNIKVTSPEVSREAQSSGKIMLTINPPDEVETTGKVVLTKTQ